MTESLKKKMMKKKKLANNSTHNIPTSGLGAYTTHQKIALSVPFRFFEKDSLCVVQNGFEISFSPPASPTPARGLQVCAKMTS